MALVRRGSRDGRPSLEDGVDYEENGFAVGEDDDEEEGGDGKQNGWAEQRTQYPPPRHTTQNGAYQAVYNDEES